MSDVSGIFDSLYSRLILRDLLAKILPGTILLATVAYAALPTETFRTLLDPPLWLALSTLGSGWLTAFAVQGLGERSGFIKNDPSGFKRKDTYKLMVEFDRRATSSQQMQAERLLVIKEACGNGSLALLLSALLTIVLWPLRVLAYKASLAGMLRMVWWPFVPLLILYLVAACSLRYMHLLHRDHFRTYMEAVIGSGFTEIDGSPVRGCTSSGLS